MSNVDAQAIAHARLFEREVVAREPDLVGERDGVAAAGVERVAEQVGEAAQRLAGGVGVARHVGADGGEGVEQKVRVELRPQRAQLLLAGEVPERLGLLAARARPPRRLDGVVDRELRHVRQQRRDADPARLARDAPKRLLAAHPHEPEQQRQHGGDVQHGADDVRAQARTATRASDIPRTMIHHGTTLTTPRIATVVIWLLSA